MEKVLAQMKKVKLLISDIDGVFTDGSFYINGKDPEYKKFNALDGLGVKLLQNADIPVAIISGRFSEATSDRMTKLGCDEDLYQGEITKMIAYNKIKKKYNLEDDQIAYIGDDIIDIPIFRVVGLPIAVANALDEVKTEALLTTKKSGGDGAVREVIDQILKSQNKYKEAIKKFTGISL